jgi:hypothetical protein
LLSALLALAWAGLRLVRAWRAASQGLSALPPVDREDLALLRTARDALSLLVNKQLRRFRVAVLGGLRRP